MEFQGVLSSAHRCQADGKSPPQLLSHTGDRARSWFKLTRVSISKWRNLCNKSNAKLLEYNQGLKTGYTSLTRAYRESHDLFKHAAAATCRCSEWGEIQEFQKEDVSEADDIPLSQLFTLPPNTNPPEDENITWKESRTVGNPPQNIFLGTHDLPEDILELNGPYGLFKFFKFAYITYRKD
nr:unnamed protein product [Callosobruchus analis]